MLVKALKLRRMGERISPEELRGTPPMVGNLSVKQDQLRRLATRGSRMALLMPLGGGCEPLAQLHSARLALVDHRGLVIQGIEESWRRKQCTDHRQALWCWPVDPSEALPKDARDAIDIEEGAAALGFRWASNLDGRPSRPLTCRSPTSVPMIGQTPPTRRWDNARIGDHNANDCP